MVRFTTSTKTFFKKTGNGLSKKVRRNKTNTLDFTH